MKNMKIKSLIAAVLPVLFGLFALQSCTKEDGKITMYQSFTTPTVSAPLDAATVKITGTTVDLKWVSTDQDGDSPVGDVYFGLDSKPALYKAANAGTTLTVPVVVGLTYYWKVTMKDKNGVMTYGPTWSFTIYDPIGIFVGNYNCVEPAEGWNYDVSFKKLTATTLQIGNGAGSYDGWWASWKATFTLDLTKNTYSMPLTDFGGGYSGIESGTINQTNGQIVGTYTVYQNGKSIETGVHTYNKK